MKKILVTGGAGYKGVILVDTLLKEGYNVTILDNFMYGYEPVLIFVKEKNCSIIKQDIRNLRESDVKGYDIIYHLAGISGYPACDANPHSAEMINVESTKNLTKLLGKKQILVYASTTSFYGKSDKVLNEDSDINPVSLYGVTKYQAEKICMGRKNSVGLRFATIFGASPKMRCDLMVNDFVFRALTERSLVLFDAHSKRTFLHVRDAARAYAMVAKSPDKMLDKVFNIGAENMNYSKMDIANKIKKYISFTVAHSELEDSDKRDFVISFDKIAALGFKPSVSIDEGIEELIKLFSFYRPYSYFRAI